MADVPDKTTASMKTTEEMEAWFNADPVLSQARRDGVDMWALWANLRRPVEERIRRHQLALNTYKMLRGKQSESDSNNLMLRLSIARIDFVIIGDYAAAFYGDNLSMKGIEICCDFATENLLRLQSAIADLNPVHRMTIHRRRLELTGETAKGFSNLYLDTDAGQLDCISEVKGVGDFERVKQQSSVVHIQRHEFRVLDLDALIASKKTMGRPRDHEAVKHLESIRQLKTKTNGGTA